MREKEESYIIFHVVTSGSEVCLKRLGVQIIGSIDNVKL